MGNLANAYPASAPTNKGMMVEGIATMKEFRTPLLRGENGSFQASM
jgi:hypothetical protein